MNLPEKSTCILSYISPKDAEQAMNKLQAQNINMAGVSIAGKGSYQQECAIGLYIQNGCVHFKSTQAKFWENIGNVLNDKLFLLVLELGPLMVAGFIVNLLVKEHDDTDIQGFSVFGRVLFSLGVPVENINQYEAAIKSGNILLIVHAECEEVERSCEILHSETQRATVHLA